MVLDATTGQNAVAQAREFSAAAQVDGIILTKLDGTAKGGVVCAIKKELGIPVRYVGVGEGIDDLQPFVAADFAKTLIEKQQKRLTRMCACCIVRKLWHRKALRIRSFWRYTAKFYPKNSGTRSACILTRIWGIPRSRKTRGFPVRRPWTPFKRAESACRS